MGRPTLRIYDGFSHTTPQYKNDVFDLQSLLKALGYRLRPDGEFGAYTEHVVRLYQASKGLEADGIVGGGTWGTLEKKAAPPKKVVVNRPTSNPVVSNSGLSFDTSYSKWDNTLLKQLELAGQYEYTIKKVASQYGIPPCVLAGIGSRESHWGLALTPPGPGGTGDRGHGRGLMQIDDRWHVPFINSGKWADGNENIVYAGKVLINGMKFFAKKTGWDMGFNLLKAGVAGYNCGPTNAWNGYRTGNGVDYYTTGKDYSKNVLERAGWFQLHGWQ